MVCIQPLNGGVIHAGSGASVLVPAFFERRGALDIVVRVIKQSAVPQFVCEGKRVRARLGPGGAVSFTQNQVAYRIWLGTIRKEIILTSQ